LDSSFLFLSKPHAIWSKNWGSVPRFTIVVNTVTLIYGLAFGELLASYGTALTAESPCEIMKAVIFPNASRSTLRSRETTPVPTECARSRPGRWSVFTTQFILCARM